MTGRRPTAPASPFVTASAISAAADAQEHQLAGIDADGNDTIYVRVLRDSNTDHRFTEENEAINLRVDLRHPAEGQRVLKEGVAKRARAIIESK